MNREQLAHVVRAAAAIAQDVEVVIIGSQAILGTADADQLPEEVTLSMEADVAFRDDASAHKADLVDGAIGELSDFHAEFGYYAQGVEIKTAVLPDGWEARVEILHRQVSEPGRARCVEPHDFVVSKLVAGRSKDITFATALIRHDFVSIETLNERAGMLHQPNAVVKRVQDLINRCAAGSTRP